MRLELETQLRLRNTPEARTLAELFKLQFPEGAFRVATVAGALSLEIQLQTTVTRQQKQIFLDLMRALEPFLVDTVLLRGRLGEYTIDGYLGPEKKEKEKSRIRLELIRQQLEFLLPEHKLVLQAILTNN